jgi:amino acid permease
MEREAGVLSSQTTVVALVNGMIGGIILVMPILALKSGFLMIAPVVMVCGFFSYYSCLLCIRHLRNYKDLDEAVLKHFDNKRSYKIFYDVCIALSLVILLILYFDLICKQWEGITARSRLIPVLNAIVLFPAVYVMKKYNFGASLLAYGIISTIGYCFFILYMWINAPSGTKHFASFDSHFPQLAAALGQGFSIQAFFVPILKKNENKNNYKQLVKYAYLIGAIVYAFIGYGGSLST